MRKKGKLLGGLILLICLLMTASFAVAAVDKVICVPWQGDVSKQHTALNGVDAQLKCVVKTTDTTTIYYKWVFGDGTPDSAIAPLSGATKYNIETTHTYTAATGTPFTAQLVVDENNALANPVTDPYLLKIEDDTLDTRINIAIDKGLWWLYRDGGTNYYSYTYAHTYDGSPHMTWVQTSHIATLAAPTASAVHAFGVNGHKIKGNPDQDPYVEAVQGGMNYLMKGYFSGTGQPALRALIIAPVNRGGGVFDDPEAGQASPNGYGIEVFDWPSGNRSPYQGGQIMDAIIASGASPTDLTGRDFAPGTPKSHIWTYGEVLQDMADMHAWGQNDYGTCNGGICGSWWYYWNYGSPGDNSASQWGAIGMLPAQQAPWNVIVPYWVKAYNANWLEYSKFNYGGNPNHYAFSYNGVGGCAGDLCQQTTTSGMVQMIFDGQTTADPKWGKAQKFIADYWRSFLHDGSTWGGYRTYGWYSFAKAMRLSLPDSTTHLLKTSGATFDWYYGNPGNAACTTEGNCEKGLAQRILETQTTTGANNGSWQSGNLTNPPLTTAWMIITLKPTLFEASPIACFNISPNPNYPNQMASFNPTCSGHSESGKDINNLTTFEWDWNNDGTYDQATPDPDTVTHSFPCASLPCTYPVKLRVTDDSDPARTAAAVLNVIISNPPHPPVAEAAGPYMTSMCAADSLTLDGSGSYDPNEGQKEAGCDTCPNDTITNYEWDTNDPLTFDTINKNGKTVILNAADIASFFDVGGNAVALRVTDNTANAYPGSGQSNLTDTDFATVDVTSGCICNLVSRIKSGKVQLTWTHTGAASYDIYRSTVGPNKGFALLKADHVTTYATYLDANVVNGATYYYRVVTSDGCGSNWVQATPKTRGPIDLRDIDNDKDGFTENQGDCDDANPNINPSAWDILDNGIDENCDGADATSPLNEDNDGDGYSESQGDCNDGDPAVNPEAAEVCNGIDDNCNDLIDEGVKTVYYLDSDSDGYGNPGIAAEACTAPPGYVPNNSDCDDANPERRPGVAEACNGIDDNCNGQIDEGATNTYYQDFDSDGYGNPAVATQACSTPPGYVSDNTDCDDLYTSIHPGAVEDCNTVDDNCNGQVDEGAANTYYQDADLDGYGNIAITTQACVAPGGYASDHTDCDDTNNSINPGAPEVCNGADDNCNDLIDEGVKTTYYQDADSDGYGNIFITALACTAPAGYVSDSTDCDDTNTNVHPGAVEVCNSIDDNCNGQIDEGVTITFYPDSDGDGYGSSAPEIGFNACTAPAGYILDHTDCNDGDSSIHPNAVDIAGNGIDENCDGTDGINPLTTDDDGDGFTENAGDCDDTDANINPNAVEIPGNEIDDNCDGINVGNPSSVTLHLSNDVIRTAGAGGSVDAECIVVDANNVPIADSFFDIFVEVSGATETALENGSRFTLPEPGEFTIKCQESVNGTIGTATVVVLDDSVNPLFSSFNNNLSNIAAAIDAGNEGDAANSLPAVQSAKNTIMTEMLSMDLAGMASNPPMPTGADVPTDAELLAAGDVPNPIVDDPFKAAIMALEQNFIDYQNLVSGLTPATITQADIDNMNALTTAGDALAAALEGMAPSHTAILAVNTELNNLVSNVMPNQTATAAQMEIDVLGTIPGIVKLNHELPLTLYAGLKTDGREPLAFYSETKPVFLLVSFMMSESIANGLRSQYIKKVYKPIISFIMKNLWFLRNQNLGPFGLNPPGLDFVFGPGASVIFEGGDIEVWGGNFAPVLGSNTIRVSTYLGDFDVAPYALMLDVGGWDILNGTLPSGMSDHPFGLWGIGVVRVITPGGTSNGVEVSIFP
ncbi:MAG: hypothetical protein HY808_14940 [Nitrospirae bacterium]|nr:hypothetical protein [Nitrospirota bacterium]